MTKVLEFSFSISPSNEYIGLISFMIDWFDLLAVQETLESLPQHHNSKVSILLLCHSFSSKEQTSFNFMAAVSLCSDFGAPKNKIFPIVSPSI